MNIGEFILENKSLAEQTIEIVSSTFENANAAFDVYPRLKSFILKSSVKKVKTFAEKSGLSPNTVSTLLSGKYVSQSTIDRLQETADQVKTDRSGEFDFELERMPAEVILNKESVQEFVSNHSKSDIAPILEIPVYLLEWILDGKPISQVMAIAITAAAKKHLQIN